MRTQSCWMILSILGLMLGPVAVRADNADVPTSIVAVPNSPITLTSCRAHPAGFGSWDGTFNVLNRTKHAMLSFRVRYRAFDSENVAIGQGTSDVAPSESLASGDTGTYSSETFFGVSEPRSSGLHLNCRVEAATFTGKRSWTFGHRWPEKLLPLGRASAFSPLPPLSRRSMPAPPRLGITVVNAWNDAVNGALFVHDSITVHGGASDATLRASDFRLTMSLANGSRRTYAGLAQPAPTFQKLNPLGPDMTSAYEVDPREDLGAMGSILVPAHGVVRTTVTFDVTDAVSDPQANRLVVIRSGYGAPRD